jgi:hypothetical protein
MAHLQDSRVQAQPASYARKGSQNEKGNKYQGNKMI